MFSMKRNQKENKPKEKNKTQRKKEIIQRKENK
jgi:hypothetical protein